MDKKSKTDMHYQVDNNIIHVALNGRSETKSFFSLQWLANWSYKKRFIHQYPSDENCQYLVTNI